MEFLNNLSEQDKDDIAQRIVTPREMNLQTDFRQRCERLEQRLRGYEQMKADGDITRERFREYKQQIEAELAELVPPPSQPNMILNYTHARELLNDLVTALSESASIAPDALNRLLRIVFKRIPIYYDKISKPELNPAFHALEQEQ